MEALKDNLEEVEIGSSVESFQKLLNSQKDLFHSQIDHLQRIVVTQCKLTGVNPLSQEMAAGALSINIAKRPRDLLNPKAVKYMHEVFSIKDAISKKEAREINAQFGVTVTQVREFFTSQRSRVRKLVRISREKAIRSVADKQPQDGVPACSDSDHMMAIDPVPLNSIVPASVNESPSSSTQDDAPPGLNDSDKQFVNDIFNMLQKEETFSGQVKAMESIVQIKNPLVIQWFLTKGGLMILATWLSQATAEEQTSVIFVCLRVLGQLPLHKALPEHMSAILHNVNRLRFYRTSDISNRARVLLAKWSKMFARSQAVKKPNSIKSSSDMQKEILLKQSLGEIMSDELWQPNIVNENLLGYSHESSENLRKIESSQGLKLLPASTDDSSRKHILGVPTSHVRERRKVQLVEQPGHKMAGRNLQATRTAPVSQRRPMSADDIQKAKLRAQHMQSKYGKTVHFSNGGIGMKSEGLNNPSNTPANIVAPVSKVHVPFKSEEEKKAMVSPPNISDKLEIPADPKLNMDSKELILEKCKRVRIPWKIPPEIKLNDNWRVGTGENSKEVDVQKNRNRREMEIIYRNVQEIPSNPKGPWDVEMDCDDSLTLEIPIEQPPEVDARETDQSQSEHVDNRIASSTLSVSQNTCASATEPDLELLAVLLKNPELVFALSSGQAADLSSEETVKLLDLIKKGGAGLTGNLSAFAGKAEERVEVSLPSPTPSSNTGMSGWGREDFKDGTTLGNRVAFSAVSVAKSVPLEEVASAATLVRSQVQTNNMILLQQSSMEVASLSEQVLASTIHLSLPQTTMMLRQKQHPSLVPSLCPRQLANSVMAATPVSGGSMVNLSSAAVSTTRSLPGRQPAPYLSSIPSLPLPAQAQAELPYMSNPPYSTQTYSNRTSPGNLGLVSDSLRARQRLPPNFVTEVNQFNFSESFGTRRSSRERENYVAPPDGFESWSPENSPMRSSNYMQDYPQPRMNTGWRQQGYSGSHKGQNSKGDGRWRGRRH